VRKQTQVDTVTGLMIETTLALPFTLIFWLFTPVNHFGFNLQGSLFILAGILTAIPLLAFAAAARRISLSMIGFLMYLNPTLQLLCAVFILGEPFTHTDLITFSLIWIGLAIFTGGTYWRHRKDRQKLRPSVTSS
jgi:chloramphenicol-sensitive protein RarD